MRRYFLIGLICLCSWSCTQHASLEQERKIETDVGRLKTALQERRAMEELQPWSAEVLAAMLPNTLTGFRLVETKSGAFQQYFSEVSRTFVDANSFYVKVRLADYEADPDGFQRIWEAYEEALVRDAGEVIDEHIQHFCWQEVDAAAKRLKRDCGLRYRLHLQMQTNVEGGSGLFEEVIEGLDWPSE